MNICRESKNKNCNKNKINRKLNLLGTNKNLKIVQRILKSSCLSNFCFVWISFMFQWWDFFQYFMHNHFIKFMDPMRILSCIRTKIWKIKLEKSIGTSFLLKIFLHFFLVVTLRGIFLNKMDFSKISVSYKP